MKAGEVQSEVTDHNPPNGLHTPTSNGLHQPTSNGQIKTRSLTQDNHKLAPTSHPNGVGELPNGTPTPYNKFLQTIQCDHRIQWELALGKRIGFYTLRGELGSGNFSRVRSGIHTLTKERVAIKILDKRKMDKKTKRLLSREISSMEKLHHPHIVHLYEVIHTETKLNLVMEYASGGELFTRLSTQGKMPESEARIVFAQIVSAIQHMHQHKVIHRDLKAENVFYSEKRHVKVGDFGFSTEADGSSEALTTFCGSPPYAAPELFRDSFYYGESVDIWALGILLYFSVTGTMPFRAETVGKLKKRILSGQFTIPSNVSSACKALIRGILKSTPSERFNIPGIRSSEWLARTSYPEPMGYYRLEPTQINLKQCKPEEAYALCYLDKLGITQELLRRFESSSTLERQSPFSWHAKESSDATMTYPVIPRRPQLPGNGQLTLGEEFRINEFSALVGTYRILLLRAHKRLYGPAGGEELRKLRALTEHALAKCRHNHHNNHSDTTWSCAMCEANDLHASTINAEGGQSEAFPSHHVTTNGAKSSWLDSTFSTVSGSNPRSHVAPARSNKVRPAGAAHIKSKFCVIL